MEGKFIETPCQAFEAIPRVMHVDSPVTPEVTRVPPKMASLKDAKAAVQEGGCTIWGQLPDFPFKSDKTGLGFTIKGQKMIRRTCRQTSFPHQQKQSPCYRRRRQQLRHQQLDLPNSKRWTQQLED